MRNGERGHDFRDIPERAAKTLRRAPRAAMAKQHGGQQQRQQEQDVVETEPDVPDAFVYVGCELLPPRSGAERLAARIGAEDRAVRAPLLEVLQQSAMRGIDIEQQ